MKLSLFAKVFATFWLTTIAVASAVAWSTWQLVMVSRDHTASGGRQGADTALLEAANAVHATRGLEGLGEWIGRLNQQRLRGGPVLLLDAKDRVLAGPVGFEHLPPTGPGSPDPVRRHRLDTGTADPLWLARLNRPPAPFFDRPGPPGPPPLPGPRTPVFEIVRIGVALTVSGLLCWLLARHLTRPIRELQAASTRLAAGDFTTGLSRRTLSGRDELAALARDFEVMAGQVRQLIEAQRQLLRNVSHELRSPLARLQVAAALARRRAGAVIDSEVDRIELETARLDELIGQLLTLVRLESSVGEAQVPLDLSALLDAVAHDARFEAEAREVVVDTSIEPGLGLRGHAELLRSVFDNVLRNAIRHSPATGIVTLTAQRDGPRDQLVVSIADQGPGVPDAMLDAMFDAFVRVDAARSADTGGHGLGLAIARQGVKAHGGSIVARNRPAGGLEVEVRFSAGRT